MWKLVFICALSLSWLGCGEEVCKDDHCVCPANDSCAHDCTTGGLDCHIQCGPGSTCDVGCVAGEECHVECTQGQSCTVDCGGSPDCNVTCPSNNCTVTNCAQGTCDVTCGLGSLPRRNGTTATCP